MIKCDISSIHLIFEKSEVVFDESKIVLEKKRNFQIIFQNQNVILILFNFKE